MFEWLADYGLFLAKGVTIVALIAILLSGFLRARREGLPGVQSGHLEVEALNERFQAEADALRSLAWDDKTWKQERKARKKADKAADASERARVYVLQFKGDLAASAVASLRHEISALLAVARPGQDEVVLLLESPGGVVHGYGLAASQLARLRTAGIRLTACVDKVAASGGYMMACVADEIIAAPFAVLGSIGVVAQIPNIHRLLKKHDVDIELMTAGEYKRTLTVLGENTDSGRRKFQEDLEDTHVLFKEFVNQWRPQVDMAQVGTGEHWFGQRALGLSLVDALKTSDDVLRSRSESADLYAVYWRQKRSLAQRLGMNAEEAVDRTLMRWWARARESHYS